MYLLTHSLSPILVLVAVMDPKELKTKISHTHSLILSWYNFGSISISLCIYLTIALSHSRSVSFSLDLCLVLSLSLSSDWPANLPVSIRQLWQNLYCWQLCRIYIVLFLLFFPILTVLCLSPRCVYPHTAGCRCRKFPITRSEWLFSSGRSS